MEDSTGILKNTITEDNSLNNRVFSVMAFVLLAFGGIFLRLPIMLSNLPVSYRVDERIGWEVLLNLQNSWNPVFFHYPTLHYYIISIANSMFAGGDPQSLLLTGRIVNLVFILLLAGITSLIAFKILRSILLALFVFAMVIFSPALAESSLYINTDIQVTFFIFLSLYFYISYRENTNEFRLWLFSLITAGLAVASKYSALGYVAALFIAEFLRSSDEYSLKSWLERSVSYKISALIVGIAGITAVIAGMFLKAENFRPLLKSGAIVSSAIDPADILFIESSLLKLAILGVLVVAFAIALYIFHERSFFKKLLRYRQVLVVVIVLVVFLLVTPYAILDWKKFIYDFAFEIKANSFSREGSQWFNYIWRIIETHGFAVFILALAGIFFSLQAFKKNTYSVILFAFFILYYISIGSAQRGSVRYLCPLLPALFLYAAIGIDALSKKINERFSLGKYSLFVLPAVIITVELFPKVSELHKLFPPKNEHYASYYKVLGLQRKEIYYSGWTPYIELRLKGIDMRPLSFFAIKDAFKNLDSNAILLVDRQAKNEIGEEAKPENIIWRDEQGFGQYLLLKNPAILQR